MWPYALSAADAFQYEETDHKCLECDNNLTLVKFSTMLTCSEGHGPFFLVED